MDPPRGKRRRIFLASLTSKYARDQNSPRPPDDEAEADENNRCQEKVTVEDRKSAFDQWCDPKITVFIELMAGSGTLTVAVRYAGVRTETPNEARDGGTDLLDPAQVQRLWDSWVELKRQGYHLIISFAPPCCSMTRACRRNWRTRVRSAAMPWGLPDLSPKNQENVEHGNQMAIATDSLAGRHTSELEQML